VRRSPTPAGRRRGPGIAPLVAVAVLTGLAGCDRAGKTGTAERDAAHLPAGLGARPEAFGVAGGRGTSGGGRSPSGPEIRWEAVGKIPRVVGVAELWDPAAGQALTAQGLRPAADTYARRWGGPDAQLVTRTVMGGVDVFQYRSDSLRASLRSSPDPAARAGRFLVAVTLATGSESSPDRPIAADPADRRRVPEGTFSIAVLAGNPWP